jgi:hypothetical protein
MRLQRFEPLFPPQDLNLLLNTQNVISIAPGQFYKFYATIICMAFFFFSKAKALSR